MPPRRRRVPRSTRASRRGACAPGSFRRSRTRMANYLARLTLMMAVLCAGPALAEAFIAPRVATVPGGVATFRLSGSPERVPTAAFNGHPVMVVRKDDSWLAIVGIALNIEPGDYHLDVQEMSGGEQRVPFTVKAKTYSVQQLKVPPSQVNLSPENEARVAREQEKVRAALDGFSAPAPATLRLDQPVPGRRSSSF